MEEQHDAVEIYDFNQKTLSILVLKDGLKVIVDEVALVYIVNESLEFFVVIVDGVEYLEESFDYFHV